MWPRHMGQFIVSGLVLVLLLIPPDVGTWVCPGAGAGCGACVGMQFPGVALYTYTFSFCPQDNPNNDTKTKSKIAINDGRVLAPLLGAIVGEAAGATCGAVAIDGAAGPGETAGKLLDGAAVFGETVGAFALGEAAQVLVMDGISLSAMLVDTLAE